MDVLLTHDPLATGPDVAFGRCPPRDHDGERAILDEFWRAVEVMVEG